MSTRKKKSRKQSKEGMERLQEESRIVKVAKTLNRERFENPFLHVKNGKHVSNPEDIYTK